MRVELSYNSIDFYINIDENNYDVFRLGKNETAGSKNFGETTERGLGHFTNLGKGIEQIIKSAFASSEETLSLREFIDRYETARKELLEIVG